jgi:hypothetical protein
MLSNDDRQRASTARGQRAQARPAAIAAGFRI